MLSWLNLIITKMELNTLALSNSQFLSTRGFVVVQYFNMKPNWQCCLCILISVFAYLYAKTQCLYLDITNASGHAFIRLYNFLLSLKILNFFGFES